MTYYKRPWEESREDDYTDWGASIWYFEIDEDGYPTKQLEQYENGKVSKYDLDNLEDDFGGLGDQAIDFEEFEAFEISKDEFYKVWAS